MESLVTAFCDAWNRHDGHALAAIMSQDVDFVNVGARWYHGRRDFETYHTRLLSGRFSQSTTGAVDIRTRFIRLDLAAVHWSWWIKGDKNFDGTPRPPRSGLMTLIAERHGERWEVIVAQNTNLLPGPPAPEEEGIGSPIPEPQAPRNSRPRTRRESPPGGWRHQTMAAPGVRRDIEHTRPKPHKGDDTALC